MVRGGKKRREREGTSETIKKCPPQKKITKRNPEKKVEDCFKSKRE